MKHKWTWVAKNTNGETFYMDFESIEERDGYVYYWMLTDNFKPTEFGDMSYQTYYQADLAGGDWADRDQFRTRILDGSFYRSPMGKGAPSSSLSRPDEDWEYAPPNTTAESILKTVCLYVLQSEEGRQKLRQYYKEKNLVKE